MKENEKFLKESIDLLNRDFGESLPTLSSVMKKHQENLKEDNTILERLFEKYGKMVLEKELHYKHVSSCTFINMLPSGGAGRHILKMILRMLDRESFYMFVKTI